MVKLDLDLDQDPQKMNADPHPQTKGNLKNPPFGHFHHFLLMQGWSVKFCCCQVGVIVEWWKASQTPSRVQEKLKQIAEIDLEENI